MKSAFETHARWLVGLLLAFVAAGILISWLAIGAPSGKLPGIALGSLALLYILRGVLLAALAAVLTIILVNGWAGQWPQTIGFGGASLGYDAADKDEKLGEAVEDLADSVEAIKRDLDSKVDGKAFGEFQGALVSELGEVRDLANAVANWAQHQEDSQKELRDRLGQVSERVAHIEGQLSRQ